MFAQANVHAANEWTDNVMTVNITTTSTDSNLKVYGGSREKMLVYISDEIPLGAMGYTDPTNCVYNNVIYEYDDHNIYEYSTYLRKIAVIYSQSFANDSGYANYYKNIITHEIGHALGWHGHSSVSSDLMYANVTKNNITVGTRDAAHLNQIYDLYR